MSPEPPPAAARARAFAAEWRLTAALVLALTVVLALTGATQRLDSILYDGVLRATPRPASERIILVTIDDYSLAELGAWPWPRSVHARLLDRLAQARPRAIGYDVLFIEPARNPAEDQALAGALRRAGHVALPLMVVTPGFDGRAYDLVEPPGAVGRSAAALGQANLHFDADGVVRRTAPFEQAGDRRIPQLMVALHAIGEGVAAPAAERPTQDGVLIRPPPQLVPFVGPPGSHRAIPAAAVLKGEAPPALFADRYVLVGATASGLHDRYATPTSGPAQLTPGIEIHANILQALLEGRAIRTAPPALLALLSCLPVIALLLALRRLGPRANLVAGAGLVLGWIAFSALLLLVFRIWAPPAPAAVGLVTLLPLWAWRRLAAANRYMADELGRFALEPDLLGASGPDPPAADVVARQIGLMEDAIARARDLRRFAADALESLPDPTFILDAGGWVLFANAAAAGQVGEAKGRRLEDLLAGWSRRAGPPVAQAGVPTAGEELTSPAGAVFQVERAPYESDGPGAAAWIVRLSDVTDARAAAAQRERLLSFLSHDMRAPQAAILALLATPAEPPVPPRLAERIGGHARRTLDLADNFIHLARAEANALTLEPLDLADLAVEAIEALWPLAQKAGVALALEGDDVALPICGDRSLIARALTNLIENALKHGAPATPVGCALRQDGAFAVFEVANAGPAMPPEQAEAILKPFVRGRSGGGGVGLGLALVQECASRHGGALSLHSPPAGGAVFALRLPLDPAEVAEPPPSPDG